MRAILILLLAATFATAGTPDRAARKAAWYRARRADAYQYPTNGLITYLSIDSRSGTTVFDTFGSNDGTAVGTPLFGSSYGKYFDGVNFNGSSQYIQIGPALDESINSSNYAIAMWINPDFDLDALADAPANDKALMRKTSPYGDEGAWIYKLDTTTDKVQFAAWNNTGTLVANVFGSNTAWSSNVWYHLAVVFNGSGYQFYINGAGDGYTADSDRFGTYNPEHHHIGSNDDVDQFFDGSLDEIAIWNRALSSNEVSEIYNNGAGRFYTP